MGASKPEIPESQDSSGQSVLPELQGWLREIAADHRLFITAAKGGNRIFEEFSPDCKPVTGLPQERTLLPVKKVFLPPSEPLFEFSRGGIEAPPTPENTVVFGLHVCELSADRLLAANMAHDRPDFPYMARRSQSLMIGVSCRRTSGCFCEKTGHDHLAPGEYDLFLHLDDPEHPRLAVGSDAGRELAANAPFPVEDPGGDVIAPAAAAPERWPLEALPEKMHDSFGAVMWDELATRCLGCGNCTIVCPLCYCFYTRDETELDPANGRRLRLWDSCQLLAFARVAGGHNFREARSERIWYRFSHKFMRTWDTFGAAGCSGCGACFHFCPVGIGPRQVIAGVLQVTTNSQDAGGNP
ncbi:MAG: 4Fe-4S dicluster domain-containing protein [Thermoleophilia bacterium]|nr:4Fe-4S dicluster domain-containing protein [Thermoleophilia bacterium]